MSKAKPQIPYSVKGLTKGLNILGYEIRYNTLKLCKEIKSTSKSGTWEQLDTKQEHKLIEHLADYFNATPAKGEKAKQFRMTAYRWTTALDAALPDRNPIKEYLMALPEWDKTERLSILMNTLFELKDPSSLLAQWTGQFIFLGAVQRVMNPGCELQEIPVLQGKADCGKSKLLSMAAGKDWFSDRIDLSHEAVEFASRLQGIWIAECAEMTGRSKADISRMKGNITCTCDVIRLSYRRDPERLYRQGIIVCTTNDHNDLPNDTSGNRRFVVCEITGRGTSPEIYIEANRDQLFAEALHLYRNGTRAGLPDSLKYVQEEVNEEHRDSSPLEDVLMEDFLDTLKPGDTFRLQEAAQKIGLCEGETRITYAQAVSNGSIHKLKTSLKAMNCCTNGLGRYGTAKPHHRWILNNER